MGDHYEVKVTVPSADDAERLGRMAVHRRLAACAQVSGPITSTYWWEGEMTSATEWVCLLKTTSTLVEPLTEALRSGHSYQTPEIIATCIAGGDSTYLAWIDSETRSDRARGPSRGEEP
jgi:periplasmic divalent cation tolerance protein